MVPPLLLDVQSHHIVHFFLSSGSALPRAIFLTSAGQVLDMCAAPGSKSSQLLEAVHASAVDPTGLLIANDSDYKRCHMLVHQSLNRIGSPSMMVTNLDASTYPTLKSFGAGGKRSGVFDRILADVPCTGDGTLRKNPNIWRDWNVRNAVGLHG
jgi:multisite-specific tRNA:(cytosine-C5)-methyltransferase